jgi:hypothetical protein
MAFEESAHRRVAEQSIGVAAKSWGSIAGRGTEML